LTYREINNGKPVFQTLYYHYARLIETLFAAERVRELLDDPDLMGNDILNRKYDFKGEGVGVIEAHAAPCSTIIGPNLTASLNVSTLSFPQVTITGL
jgi:coenzyme F420-reducing hydrogenase alpha subunit